MFVVDPETRRFLMLSSPKKRRRAGWEIPNGAVEAGESLAEAVNRELAEEVGTAVEVEVLGTVHAWTYRYDDNVPHMVSIAYVASYGGGEVTPGDDMAGADVWWAALDELRAIEAEDRLGLIPEGSWLFERALQCFDMWR